MGIYAYRYGSIPSNSTVSITEQEYDKAMELKKPMFCFIVAPDQPWPQNKVEDEPGKSKLREFKAKINGDHVRDVFTTPENLALKVSTSLAYHLTKGMVSEFAISKDKALSGDDAALAEFRQFGYPKTFEAIVRKSIRNLSAEELAVLRTGFSRMMSINDNRGYKYLAGIHGIPDFKAKYGDPRLFLPWNRAYIYWFERYLQDALYDSSVSIPWWDWISGPSRIEGIPKGFSDATIHGKPNPLYSFHVVLQDEISLRSFIDLTRCRKSRKYDTRRHPGSPTDLPTAKQIETTLDLTDYFDFSDQLEDYNNRVQIWVGGKCGDMSYIPFAAYDPIFWSHRAMIDKIFWLWQLRSGNSLPGDIFSEVLDPFRLTVRDVPRYTSIRL